MDKTHRQQAPWRRHCTVGSKCDAHSTTGINVLSTVLWIILIVVIAVVAFIGLVIRNQIRYRMRLRRQKQRAQQRSDSPPSTAACGCLRQAAATLPDCCQTGRNLPISRQAAYRHYPPGGPDRRAPTASQATGQCITNRSDTPHSKLAARPFTGAKSRRPRPTRRPRFK